MNQVLSIEQKEAIKKAIIDSGYILNLDVSIYESYSGRFMFGETCFGLVSENKEQIPFILGHLVPTDFCELSLDLMKVFKVDNLGLNYITYFPGYLWSEAKVNGTVNTTSEIS
jgi:hypothetical protein